MVFLKRSFEKTLFLTVFLCLIPYFSKPGPNTGSMVSCILQAFHRLHFRSKLASKFFSDLVFWAKKWMKKNVEKFFLICSSYFSTLTKDTETILPQDKQQGCGLFCTNQVFVIKYDAFVSLLKILDFFEKFLSSFLLELVYLYPVYQDRERIRSPWFRNLYEGSVGYV